MFKNLLSSVTGTEVEERSISEEILSNTDSADITETEEHVTVYSKREPLPWSLRGPAYNRPLPMPVFSSPIASTISGPKSPISPINKSPFAEDVQIIKKIRELSPRAVSPFHNLAEVKDPLAGTVPQTQSITPPLKPPDEEGNAPRNDALSPSKAIPIAMDSGFISSGYSLSPLHDVQLTFATSPAVPELSPAAPPSPKGRDLGISPAPPSPKGRDLGISPVPPLASSHDASFEETSPPQISRPSSKSDGEFRAENASFVAVPIPTSNAPLLESLVLPSVVDYARTPSPMGLGAPMIDIQSPLSAPHERTPPLPQQEPRAVVEIEPSPVLETVQSISSLNLSGDRAETSPQLVPNTFFSRGQDLTFSSVGSGLNIPSVASPAASLTPKESLKASPAPSLSLLEAGLSPTVVELGHQPILGDKRDRAPTPALSTSSVVQEITHHAPKLPRLPTSHEAQAEAELTIVKDRSRLEFIRYRKDWKVNRTYPSDQFFFPPLFNPNRLQYVHIPRKRRPVPRKFLHVTEDVDPGARYRRDWQVQRRYSVEKYFNPQLFEPARLVRVNIPMTRNQKKRRFRNRMAALGASDLNSPGAKLRLDWETSRTHPVEHFFEPQLFNSIVPEAERLREDWYTLRDHSPEFYYNPPLLSLEYTKRRIVPTHQMIDRLVNHVPPKYPKRIKPHYTDPGQKYREDWKVTRQNDVTLYFEPSLFDEEEALRQKDYWAGIIANFYVNNPEKRSSEMLEAERQTALRAKEKAKAKESALAQATAQKAQEETEQKKYHEEIKAEKLVEESEGKAQETAKLLSTMEAEEEARSEESKKKAEQQLAALRAKEMATLRVEKERLRKAKELESKTAALASQAKATLAVDAEFSQPLTLQDSLETVTTALAAIPRLREMYGETDSEGRSYDWDFWQSLLQNTHLDDQGGQELERHLMHPKFAGIPTELRPVVWSLAAGDEASREKALYEMHRGIPSSYEESIMADVQRLILERGLNPEQASALHNVLSAYVNHDPEIAHCPAVAEIAATLVQTLPEGDSFAKLKHIMRSMNHRRYLQPAIGATGVLAFQMENLLLEWDPELTMHLNHLGIDTSLYAQDMYATLLSKTGPEVLDLYILQGNSAIHKLVLAGIIENRDELLESDSFAEIMEILLGNLFDVHPDWSMREWILTASSILITDDDLSALYEDYLVKGRLLHEQQVLSDLTIIESEHAEIHWHLWWLSQRIGYICWSRESLASQVFEVSHNNRLLVQEKYGIDHRIYELEREMEKREMEHREEVKRLKGLLNPENFRKQEGEVVHNITVQENRKGEKIFKV